jgi:lambda family phage holin
MQMPEKDPGAWFAIWSTIPEPAKAALLNVILGALMALKSKDRTLMGATLEVTIGGVVTYFAGSAFEAFGLSSGWCYAVGGAIGVFGVEQCKAFAKSWAERKTQ